MPVAFSSLYLARSLVQLPVATQALLLAAAALVAANSPISQHDTIVVGYASSTRWPDPHTQPIVPVVRRGVRADWFLLSTSRPREHRFRASPPLTSSSPSITDALSSGAASAAGVVLTRRSCPQKVLPCPTSGLHLALRSMVCLFVASSQPLYPQHFVCCLDTIYTTS